MNSQNEKECISCFASTKFPNTIIEKNGTCNRCNSVNFENRLKNQTVSKLSELLAITDEIKDKSTGKYDCIIGASGGLDSSYMIYIAKKMLNLNPLVVKYHSGMCYEIGDENLKTICNKLNVDCKIIKSKKQNDYKFTKYLVLALRDIELYWGICSCCHWASHAVKWKAMLENNIVLNLVSDNQNQTFPVNKKDKLKVLFKQLFKVNFLKWFRAVYYLLIAFYYLFRFRLEFYVPPLIDLIRDYPRKPKNIIKLQIEKYIKWGNPYQIAHVLEKELGWKPENPEFPMRFDCKIEDSFLNKTFKIATGNTTHAIMCNNLIHGKIKTKSELKDVVEHHDILIDEMSKELKGYLKIK